MRVLIHLLRAGTPKGPDSYKDTETSRMLRIPKKKFRHHSLTGRITPDTLYKAWRKVRANRGAAGVDKQSVAMFESNVDANLAKLLRELKDGSFRPLPLLRRFIEKMGGKFRPLGIPTAYS